MTLEWFEILSLVLNLVLGGGLIVTLVTLRAVRREADANAKKAEANAKAAEASAKASEIENVESAVKIWRELATRMGERQQKLAAQVEELSVEVRRLKNATNRVVRLLDRITPENMQEMVEVIKQEIEHEQNDIKCTTCGAASDGVQGESADNGGSHKND